MLYMEDHTFNLTWEIKLLIVDELLHTTFTYRTFDVLSYAYRRTLSNEDTLVDADFIALYPQLLHK